MALTTPLPRLAARRWRPTLIMGLLGATAAFSTGLGRVPTYTASTRFTLDADPPKKQAEADAGADAARAIATSPTLVKAALDDAGVRRDVLEVADKEIAVESLGSSGVVALRVTDRSRTVAVTLADALTARVLRTRVAVSRGESRSLEQSLDKEITALSRRIVALEGGSDVSRNLLMHRRTVLESQRIALFATAANRPNPTVISSASTSGRQESSADLVGIGLGGMLGVALALTLAAAIEAVRPVISGSDAVAAEFGVPLLADLRGHPSDPAVPQLSELATRTRLAAVRAGVHRIGLLQPSAVTADVTALAERLDEALRRQVSSGENGAAAERSRELVVAARANRPAWDRLDLADYPGAAPDQRIRIRSLNLYEPTADDSIVTGLIVVAPRRLPRSYAQDMRYVLAVTPGELLGVVTHR